MDMFQNIVHVFRQKEIAATFKGQSEGLQCRKTKREVKK